MPVVDLADYLGMPQQAPADPLFYQNQRKASIDREIADFNQRVGARDQLSRLQRQAPVLQAQQAQNAYDEVAQQARDLRMKQEIEAQVERAASELAGGNLNPESDDFAVKYRDLATRNPLAFSDSRFKSVAGLYEDQFKANQEARRQQMEAEARAAQARIDAANAARAFGVPGITDDMSVRDIKIAQGNWKNANAGKRGSAQDVTRQMLEKDYELVDKDWNEMKKEGENVIYDAKGVEMPNPEFQKLDEERKILRDKLRGFYQSKYSPKEGVATTQAVQQQVSPSAAAARSALTGMASIATPFSPAALPAAAISSALPQATVPQPTPESEVIIDINDPSADENTYMAAISDAKTTPDVKRQALEKLRQFAKKPRKLSGLTMKAAGERKNKLNMMVEAAEKQLRMAPEVGKYNQAWDTEKSKVAGWIKEFADELGVDADELENSIAIREPISSDAFDADGNLITARDKFEEFLRKKNDGKSPLQDKAEKINQFRRSEFANELKEGLSPIEKLQTLAAAGLSMALVPFLGGDAASYAGKLLPDKSKTYEDVLDIYLNEKVKVVNPSVPATTPENAAKKTNLLKKVGIGANG